SIVGGYLATISLRTPIFYTIFPFLIALIIIFFIDEPPYEKKADATLNGHMLESTKDVLKNKQLMFILLGGIVAWSFGESTHFLSQLFFQFKNIPILWFGYATAAEFALSSLGFYFSHAISERFGNKRTVIMSVILLALLLIFATWTTGLTMLILFSTSSFFFGLRSPILGHLWNEECESRKRATMNSINALVYQLGVAIVIPIVGYWSDLFSVSTAFLLSGLIILIIPPIFFAFLKNN
ncbi:MAG: MFS transporter, partial [Candidatus Magasanikiibacteriota bacterium]